MTHLNPVVAAEERLPNAEITTPDCGACLAEMTFDGDDFLCDECGLAYDPNGLTPVYADPDKAPCAKPCANQWHRPAALAPDGYDCGLCALPAGHTSDCWTGCLPRRLGQ